MPKPQQPELRRSGRVPALDPDAAEAVRAAERGVAEHTPQQPVPPDQQPGHHPDRDQDKPDLDAMAQQLGIPAEGRDADDKRSDRDDTDARDPGTDQR